MVNRNGIFEDFLYALRSFESGVDYERYQNGQITEWQIRNWVGEDNWEAYQAGELTWGEMQYKSMNSLGFVGYQFGEALLIDLGYYKDDVYYGNGASTNTWDGRFTGKNGINSLEDLKTDLQDKVILDAFGYNLNVIQNGLKNSGNTLDDFIGQTFTYKDIDGSTVSVEMSLTGILAAAHLRGAWGTLSLLQGGGASADEYGTSILKYIEKFGGYESPSVEELINDYLVSTDQAPVGEGGAGFALTWAWGSHEVIEGFDPTEDRISFADQFGADDIDITEINGNVVIEVLYAGDAQQSYTLEGVSLSELSVSNFVRVSGSKDFISQALGSAGSSDVNSDTAGSQDAGASDGSSAEGPTGNETDTFAEASPDTHDHGEMSGDNDTSSAGNGGEGTTVEEQSGSGSSGGNTTTFTGGGQAYAVNASGADIVGFDPATDQLDFGSISVHGLILTQTADGEASLRNVWNSEEQILKGVSIADLTVESLGVVGNEHLRQDLGGILSWEQGIGPRNANTVYILSHQVGKVTTITDFNPATDKISFLYYGTRERLTVDQNGNDLVISNETTDQTFIFKNLSLRDLAANQLEFHFDQVMEDNLEGAFGVSQEDVSLASRADLLTPDSGGRTTDGHQVREGSPVPVEYDPTGEPSMSDHSQHDHGDHSDMGDTHDHGEMSGDNDTSSAGGMSMGGHDGSTDMASSSEGQVGAGEPSSDIPLAENSGEEGHIHQITWHWGEHDQFHFNPTSDAVDLGWMTADSFELSQTRDGILIEIVGNEQSYLLLGADTPDLSPDNFMTLDASARQEVFDFFS